MAERRGRATKARRKRLLTVSVAVLVPVAYFWGAVWPYLLAGIVGGSLGAACWWLWHRHQTETRADAAFRQRDAVLLSHRTVADLDRLSGTEFEHLVAALLRRDGCTEVVHTGGPGDNGVDVAARLPDGRTVAVQCKRYAPHRTISNGEMLTLLGSRTHVGSDLALFVTTAMVSRPAEKTAVANGILAIHRDHLGHWHRGSHITSFLAVNGSGQGDHRHRRRKATTYPKPPKPRRRPKPTHPEAR